MLQTKQEHAADDVYPAAKVENASPARLLAGDDPYMGAVVDASELTEKIADKKDRGMADH